MIDADELLLLLWEEDDIAADGDEQPEGIVASEYRTHAIGREDRTVLAIWSNMKSAQFVKDPDATLDYTVDWREWLSGSEAISISAWTVPIGITLVSEAVTSTTATIVVSGGTEGETYELVNRVTTTGGKVDDRTITLHVEQR